IFTSHLHCFFIREVADALEGFEVELHPEQFILRIDEAEGVATESMHVPVAVGCAAVGHQEHHLVKAFGVKTPEIPYHGCALTVSVWIALLGVNEVAEFLWILNEENRSVISNEVPVAVFGVELD